MFDSALDFEQPFGHDRVMHRTYVRRRFVTTLVVAVLAGAVTPAVAGAFAAPALAPVTQRTYVVRAGDTLWSIAARLSPGRDPRPVIESIERANHIDPGHLVPGRRLVITSSP
jgi:nucleoid-associated protein YgaU